MRSQPWPHSAGGQILLLALLTVLTVAPFAAASAQTQPASPTIAATPETVTTEFAPPLRTGLNLCPLAAAEPGCPEPPYQHLRSNARTAFWPLRAEMGLLVERLGHQSDHCPDHRHHLYLDSV